MTSDPRSHKTNQTLERELEEIRAVLTDQDAPEPPELLNQAVLNAARRELEGREKSSLRRFPVRWMGAFATASVVLLALGLIVQQEQESTGLVTDEADQAILETAAPMVESKKAAARLAVQESADHAAPAKNEEKPIEVRSPEDWIEQMLELKNSNRQAQLAEELQAFRSFYPDYPLPPELDN